MTVAFDATDAVASLMDDGWIDEIQFEIRSGKEAVVYAVRGGPRLDGAMVAAKVYKPRGTRSFRNDGVYQAGRVQFAHETREHRALRKGTAAGRRMAAALWLEAEWETLGVLFEAGAPVPQPIARNDQALLMEFVGDDDGHPAPRLQDVEVDPADAVRVVDELLDFVELALDCHRVHGDLSPYNVLWRHRRPIVIDVPQSIDPRLNPAAEVLLCRDVAALCRWANRHDARRDATAISRDLWGRFVVGELG